jgi:hypothetical protein
MTARRGASVSGQNRLREKLARTDAAAIDAQPGGRTIRTSEHAPWRVSRERNASATVTGADTLGCCHDAYSLTCLAPPLPREVAKLRRPRRDHDVFYEERRIGRDWLVEAGAGRPPPGSSRGAASTLPV